VAPISTYTHLLFDELLFLCVCSYFDAWVMLTLPITTHAHQMIMMMMVMMMIIMSDENDDHDLKMILSVWS